MLDETRVAELVSEGEQKLQRDSSFIEAKNSPPLKTMIRFVITSWRNLTSGFSDSLRMSKKL